MSKRERQGEAQAVVYRIDAERYPRVVIRLVRLGQLASKFTILVEQNGLFSIKTVKQGASFLSGDTLAEGTFASGLTVTDAAAAGRTTTYLRGTTRAQQTKARRKR